MASPDAPVTDASNVVVTNVAIARALERLAALLEERGDNPHRIGAYLNAAETVRAAPRPLADVLEEDGIEGLKALPGIGDGIAARIAAYVHTGRLALVEQLLATFSPELAFMRVAGIGAELARRIHDELGVRSLEELEMAAYDGRLEGLDGFGARRVQAVRDQLNVVLSRASRRRVRQLSRKAHRTPTRPEADLPPVRDLLNVDLEYRVRGGAGELETIAPSRFNPTGEAWLPILHTRRGAWRFTALFSTTARAYELKKNHDWVVIHYERAGVEGQCTVVTETRGDCKGLRVVRGREAESGLFYTERPRRAA